MKGINPAFSVTVIPLNLMNIKRTLSKIDGCYDIRKKMEELHMVSIGVETGIKELEFENVDIENIELYSLTVLLKINSKRADINCKGVAELTIWVTKKEWNVLLYGYNQMSWTIHLTELDILALANDVKKLRKVESKELFRTLFKAVVNGYDEYIKDLIREFSTYKEKRINFFFDKKDLHFKHI